MNEVAPFLMNGVVLVGSGGQSKLLEDCRIDAEQGSGSMFQELECMMDKANLHLFGIN